MLQFVMTDTEVIITTSICADHSDQPPVLSLTVCSLDDSQTLL